jgi:hypothetical protein
MLPAESSPFAIVAYVFGVLLSVPALIALVRAVFFFATVTTKLNAVVDGLGTLVHEMQDFRSEQNQQMEAVRTRLALIDQRHDDEDRRTGPADRRHG